MVLTVILCIIFSILSTAMLSYISMAVMIGPWIHAIVIILASLLLSVFGARIARAQRVESLVLITAGASIGGILATGFGFAFPTLFFLNADLFNQWLAAPAYFVGVTAVLAFAAGAFGLLIADVFEHKLIVADKLPFPVGQINYTLITMQNTAQQTYQLIAGAFASGLYSFVMYMSAIAQKITVLPALTLRHITIPALAIPTQEFPLLIAIGFIAGNMLLVPMIIGIATKIIVINPAHNYFFSYLSLNDFSFAFVSGMVVYGAMISLIELPRFFKGITTKMRESGQCGVGSVSFFKSRAWIFVLLCMVSLLTYFKFGAVFQLYLIIFTAACAYQLLIIGGEIGLAPVARFATFVMMPAMFLFAPNYTQVAILSTFVEVCGGVAVDVLFGRKLGQLSAVTREKIRRFQWLGLLVSSLSVGVLLLVLIKKFGLGTEALLAQRSQTRALTIQFQNFDFYAVIFGALFGLLLKEFKMSPIMVLGGILMPIDWAFSLIIGSGIASLMHNAQEYQSFWSGVFAINSMIMIIRALL